jgi:hypothetical protein
MAATSIAQGDRDAGLAVAAGLAMRQAGAD